MLQLGKVQLTKQGSYHTMVTPWGNRGKRYNARNNARWTHADEKDHARPEWTTSIRGQDSPWKSQSEWQRTEIDGERKYVHSVVGSRTAKELNNNIVNLLVMSNRLRMLDMAATENITR